MGGCGCVEPRQIDYVNPDDRDAKPPAVRRVVEVLASGSRIDTSVPERARPPMRS